MKTSPHPLLFKLLILVACLSFTPSLLAYYSPEMGRWIARDPIGEQGGINLYGMVHNDPVNWFDTDGRAPMSGGIGGPQFIPTGGFPFTPAEQPYTTEPGSDGKPQTKISDCNIVIFIGHNGKVPQGDSIKGSPDTACTNASCGYTNKYKPAKPDYPVPGVVPYNNNPYRNGGPGDVSGPDAFQWGLHAFENAVQHAQKICERGNCCKVTVSVECRFGWFENGWTIEAEKGKPKTPWNGKDLCGLKEVIECKKK